MKKYRTITVYTREGIDNLMDFDEIKRAALREGSLSRALNDLLEKVLEAAKSVNFKPSNELGLGDLWAYLTDLDSQGLIEMLNECGDYYFNKKEYPLICFVNEFTGEVEDISIDEIMHVED